MSETIAANNIECRRRQKDHRLYLLVHVRRQSAKVDVGDQENAEEDDQAHEESEAVGEHSFRRKMHIPILSIDRHKQYNSQ